MLVADVSNAVLSGTKTVLESASWNVCHSYCILSHIVCFKLDLSSQQHDAKVTSVAVFLETSSRFNIGWLES